MFAFARFIIRHKVGATAVVALGVFFMSPGQEEAPRSNSPWALDAAPAKAATGEPGMIDGMVDSTVAFLDENGMNPMSAGEETVGRLDETAAVMGSANSGS